MKPEDHHLCPPRRVSLRDGQTITLRLVEISDLPALIEFYQEIPPEDYLYYRASSAQLVTEAETWVPSAATGPTMVCLVLVDDAGRIHGEAWYDWEESPDISKFGICIRRTMQGQGAGRLITTRLLEIGDIYGPPVMYLTVQKENERAWKLYTSLGFKIIREQIRPARRTRPEMPEFYMERPMGVS